MRNYAYLSRRKLENYYPQLPLDYRERVETKIGFDVKVAKLEIGSKLGELSDHDKVQALEAYLADRGEVGDVDSDREWIRGRMKAGSLSDYPKLFVVGSPEPADYPTVIGLSGSVEHLIGWDVDRLKTDEPDLLLQRRSQEVGVGPLGTRIFGSTNSNNWQFADRLLQLGAYQKYEHTTLPSEKLNKLFGMVHAADPWGHGGIDARLLEEMSKHDRDTSLRGRMQRFFFLRRVRRDLGKETYRAARAALTISETQIEKGKSDLLSAVYSVNVSTNQRVDVDFLARRLITGYQNKRRTILATPVYIAIAD
jgi:hypothetical protein